MARYLSSRSSEPRKQAVHHETKTSTVIKQCHTVGTPFLELFRSCNPSISLSASRTPPPVPRSRSRFCNHVIASLSTLSAHSFVVPQRVRKHVVICPASTCLPHFKVLELASIVRHMLPFRGVAAFFRWGGKGNTRETGSAKGGRDSGTGSLGE